MESRSGRASLSRRPAGAVMHAAGRTVREGFRLTSRTTRALGRAARRAAAARRHARSNR